MTSTNLSSAGVVPPITTCPACGRVGLVGLHWRGKNIGTACKSCDFDLGELRGWALDNLLHVLIAEAQR